MCSCYKVFASDFIKEVIVIAVQFKKTGVVNASGEGVNPNIIPGTSSAEVQYTYPSASVYQDNFTVSTTVIPSASQYVVSFWAKSTVSGDKVRMHWYNPNTTTRCESSQGIVTTATDGNIDITLSTEWKFYWVVYTQSATSAVKRLIFPRMFGQERSEAAKGTGTVSVKCLKMEEGTVPTPWVANDTDTNYVGSTVGFSETNGTPSIGKAGYVQTTNFIEY